MTLAIEGLCSAYGRIEVLHGLDLHVDKGEIVALVGANGAGKTTLMRCISGLQPVRSGRVVLAGRDITGVAAHKRVALGIVQSPEGRQIFTNLTVAENLRLGAYGFRDGRVASGREEVYELFPILRERHSQIAGGLSGGQQQMLAIGRALMSRPAFLLLDEPSLGLAPLIVDQIMGVISGLKERGITVLLVEQNANAALAIADRGYVIETGRIVIEGPAAGLRSNPEIRKAFIGV
jgi:branched-chain amino acid transport system ATP-binding protein